MKQNVRFQGRICPEKFQLDQIYNGQLVAIGYSTFYHKVAKALVIDIVKFRTIFNTSPLIPPAFKVHCFSVNCTAMVFGGFFLQI